MHYLVVNPVAGRGRALALREHVEGFFVAEGLALTTLFTERPGHATDLVAALPKDAVVLSLGGDGTLHEIAAACVYTERTVGVLPAGSGDDFAYALGIPRNDPAAALHTVLAGHWRRFDTGTVNTGTVNGRVFVNSFGVGFDADVAYGVHRAPVRFKERGAYLYTILATLARLQNVPVTVTVDGAEVFAGPALLVAVQNGPRTGGSFRFAPHAVPDDGLLEVVVAAGFGRVGTLRILPRVMAGTHLDHPRVSTYRGRDIVVAWSAPRPGHMEGELIEPAATFRVCVQPKSLRVFAPHRT